MPTRRQLTYINKSYQKYLSKIEEYERSGRGFKAQGHTDIDNYTERYLIRKRKGYRVSELPDIIAESGLTFTLDEAATIADRIIMSGKDPKLFMIADESMYDENGDVVREVLISRILAMDGNTAFDFVSSLIDQDIYESHDDFQEAVY